MPQPHQEEGLAKMSWKTAFMATPGPRNWLPALILFLKGICMGAADIIPGVSGGTIAFISGIYESLIRAIASFDLTFVKQFFTLRWKTALSGVHLRFMLCLYCGVTLAIFSTASLMQHLMDAYPVLTWSAFFGLIGGSILIVFREVVRWSLWRGLLTLMGGLAAWYLCGMIPIQTPDTLWFIFLCGVIGISAMILPGISGSFMLLVLGKYYYIIGCLKTLIQAGEKTIGMDFSGAYVLLAGSATEMSVFWALIAFQAGQLFGIVGFSRFLKWLLARWHEGTMCVLAGMMIGAMRKIWPWKHTVEMNEVQEKLQVFSEHVVWPCKHTFGINEIQSKSQALLENPVWPWVQEKFQVLQENMVWPWNYAQEHLVQINLIEDGKRSEVVEQVVSGLNPQTGLALGMMVLGFLIVLGIEYLAGYGDKKVTKRATDNRAQ